MPATESPKRLVYLDHAATTPTDPRVVEAMLPFFANSFGNPSALYSLGQEAQQTLRDCRKRVATILGTNPDSIIFTNGGSESDNLAIYGLARAHEQHGKHIITLAIEHHAVLHPLNDLHEAGFEITYIEVDKTGGVDPKKIIQAIRPDTILISIMYANNEIGTIEPIGEIGKELLKYRKEKGSAYPYFHTDACQAAGYLDLNVERLHVDLMTINGSKMYGPKGSGILYIRKGTRIEPLVRGGSQEFGKRAGTENIPGIVGFTKALELAELSKETETKRLRDVCAYFWEELQKNCTGLIWHGPVIGTDRLPNNLNIAFSGVDGQMLLLYLDNVGIMCSTGSACTARSTEASHVLTAIGTSLVESKSTLRFSLGHGTTISDIDYTVEQVTRLVSLLRSLPAA